MRIVHHVQGSQAWLDWRNGGIGSSDAMVIAAAHGMITEKPWMRSLDDLYEEKMTGISKVVMNARMQRGHDGEAAARKAFEKRTGMVVSPLCAEYDHNPHMKASFDGISFDGLTTCEIKCPHESVHTLAKEGRIVDYYLPQVAHQGIVAWGHPSVWDSKATCYFATYIPETDDLQVVNMPAAQIVQFATELFRREEEFLVSLQNGVPPCGIEYAVLAKRYLGIETEIKSLEKIKASIRDGMIKLATNRDLTSMDGLGVTLEYRERTGTIDYDAMCVHYQITSTEKEKYRKKGTNFWQIRIDPKRENEETQAAAQELKQVGDVKQAIEQLTDSFWDALAIDVSHCQSTYTHAEAA